MGLRAAGLRGERSRAQARAARRRGASSTNGWSGAKASTKEAPPRGPRAARGAQQGPWPYRSVTLFSTAAATCCSR